MKITASKLLNHIPGPVTQGWPMGERFASGFKLSVHRAMHFLLRPEQRIIFLSFQMISKPGWYFGDPRVEKPIFHEFNRFID